MTKKTFAGIATVLLTQVILISLGIWQLQRLEWKEALLEATKPEAIAQIESLNFQTVNIEQLRKNGLVYRPVYVIGQPDCDLVSFVGIRTHQKVPGYHVVLPIDIEQEKLLPVAIGWINAKHFDVFQLPEKFCRTKQRFEGILTDAETGNIFTPKADLQRSLWYTLDVEDMAVSKGYQTVNAILRRTVPQENLKFLVPVPSKFHLQNRHLEYALTWFSFAGILLIISVLLFLKKTPIKA